MVAKHRSVLSILLGIAAAGAASAGPDASPLGFAVGDRFDFTAVHADPSSGTEKQGGVVHVTSILPKEQTVTVVEEKACGTAPCFVLEAHRTLPVYGVGTNETRNISTSRARIDKATGKLIDIEQTMTIAGQVHAGNPTPVKSKNSIFADFYGPWMLDLRPGYKESFPISDGRERTYEVVRQEKVAGRNAFVVKRRTPQPDGRILETTYWVDIERRFALQVEQEGWRMTLQKSSSKS
jgi:hypothetical protein